MGLCKMIDAMFGSVFGTPMSTDKCHLPATSTVKHHVFLVCRSRDMRTGVHMLRRHVLFLFQGLCALIEIPCAMDICLGFSYKYCHGAYMYIERTFYKLCVRHSVLFHFEGFPMLVQ